jgi:hypothetical protein
MISRKDARSAKKNDPPHRYDSPLALGLPRRGHFFAAESAKKRSYFLARKSLALATRKATASSGVTRISETPTGVSGGSRN